MRAFRFLAVDHRDPRTGVVWTGDWIAPSGGVVAFRKEHLHHWIAPELWQVELDGPIVERELSLIGARGRLRAQIEGWDANAATDFLGWCAARHPAMGLDPTARAPVAACCAGYVVAQAAGMAGARTGAAYEDAEAAGARSSVTGCWRVSGWCRSEAVVTHLVVPGLRG
jgi:hypothetical protein